MREFRFVPKVCIGDNAEFEGFITLTAPNMIQRYKYLSECSFDTNESGEVDLSIKKIDPMIKMMELSAPHFKSVDIRRKDGLASYKTFDDLINDSTCESIVMEACGVVMGGFKPSKNLNPL